MKKDYFVYITSNRMRTVLYIGITNSIERRYFEHLLKKDKDSFTARYQVNDLVYCEIFSSPEDAIRREKQLKGWTRKRKEELIKSVNPTMRSLQEDNRRDSSLRSE